MSAFGQEPEVACIKPVTLPPGRAKSFNETSANGIGYNCKNLRNVAIAPERNQARQARGQDNVRGECDQFCCNFARVIDRARVPSKIDLHILADNPTSLLHTLQECCSSCLAFRILS